MWNGGELCGTFLTTRGQTYTKGTQEQKTTRKHGPILKHDNTMKTGNRCINVQPLMGQNLLDESGYEYKLVNPVMSKPAYAKMMFTKLLWEPNFRMFSTFVLSFIKIYNIKYGNIHGKNINSE